MRMFLGFIMPQEKPVVQQKFKFKEGEKVLCFHGPLIYEAKCLECECKDKQVKYYIHYAGWNKNWDEWVPESRVLKYNDNNLQRQRELQRAHRANPPKSKKCPKYRKLDNGEKEPSSRSSTPSTTEKCIPLKIPTKLPSSSSSSSTAIVSQDSPADAPLKKNRIDPTVETEEQFMTKVECKVKIPDELKPCLVDDWDIVCNQRKLPIVPSKIPVDTIFESYIKYKDSSKANNQYKRKAQVEMIDGLREYFNAMLGSQLLYKCEKQQHQEITRDHPNVPASQIYGPPHLLRLFVKLGSMLVYTALDEKTMNILLYHLQDFLKVRGVLYIDGLKEEHRNLKISRNDLR